MVTLAPSSACIFFSSVQLHISKKSFDASYLFRSQKYLTMITTFKHYTSKMKIRTHSHQKKLCLFLLNCVAMSLQVQQPNLDEKIIRLFSR